MSKLSNDVVFQDTYPGYEPVIKEIECQATYTRSALVLISRAMRHNAEPPPIGILPKAAPIAEADASAQSAAQNTTAQVRA